MTIASLGRTRRIEARHWAWVLAFALALLACAEPETGRLSIRIVDESGEPTPARVELIDSDGTAWVPPEALPLRFECFAAPLSEWAAQYVTRSDRIAYRPAGTDQFYLDGPGNVDLPAGRYQLRVYRGIEVAVEKREIEIAPGSNETVEVILKRWVDMAAEGWWSVDDHVHITRLTPEDDANLAAWMAAEDLRVANLLAMGTVDQISVTPQHDFGEAGEYRRDDTLLLSGQEHPRTHFLGHTITLGSDVLVDERDTYIDYATTFRGGLENGAVSGYAHWGLGPARTGLSLDAPRRLVFFLEVLQFEFPWYQEWYDLLDLGLRIAPTAGTDFPCGNFAGVPGRERFYVALGAPPTRQSFVAAVRAGRTFVTNGPLLALSLAGHGIGDEIARDGPATLPVSGRVRFDPERDDVKHVELVVNGEIQPLTVTTAGPGELRFETDLSVERSSWVALRTRGDKRGEAPMGANAPAPIQWLVDHAFDFREMAESSEAYYASRDRVRPSAAHTGAIYVRLPDSESSSRARERAEEALARLADLEDRLSDERIADQTLWDWFPYADAVSEEHLRRNRPALLAAIQEARPYYEAILANR